MFQTTPMQDQILDAALIHVAFDGWSQSTLDAAVEDTGVSPQMASLAFPRGAIDLAASFHRRADTRMAQQVMNADLTEMKFRARVAYAVRKRLTMVADDKEAVRRGATFFALPPHVPEGATLMWHTADCIWNALGDTSQDYNWYTKRATLSAVYGATVLFWLGDDSLEHQATWEFLDRRIENVMQFEKAKAHVQKAPGAASVFECLSKYVTAPQSRRDMPGQFHT